MNRLGARFGASRTTRSTREDSLAGDALADSPDGLDGRRRPALIVGLGNPGKEYRDTRHNVGAWCVELLAKRHGGELKRQQQVNAATVTIDGHTVHLARPRSYMNVSGPPVAAELRRLHLPPPRLLVVYDELDLPAGQLRIRTQGGHGGHNGMRSVIGALGGGDFARIRLGIGRPSDGETPVYDPDRVAAWVLGAPPASDRRVLEEMVARAADAIELAVAEGVDLAMSRFNLPGTGQAKTNPAP